MGAVRHSCVSKVPIVSGVIWIKNEVFGFLCAEAERMHPQETGGVIMGWQDGPDFVVKAACGPGPSAEHGRYRFRPDGDYRVDEVLRHFKQSEGVNRYLGDWHTHPDQENPSLSLLDIYELGRIGLNTAPPLANPLMVVLGITRTFNLRAWHGDFFFPADWKLPIVRPRALEMKFF